MPPPDDHHEEESADFSWDAQEALDDPDGPQECDLVGHDDDDTETEPCPNCGEEIAEYAERCPYCGEWVVTGGSTGLSNRGLVFAAVVFALILIVFYWLI